MRTKQPYFWVALFFAILSVFAFLGTFVWATWVNPTANPPGGDGAISVDVNGVVNFSKDINLNSNKVINLAWPISNTDAVTKNYVDNHGAIGATPAKLWGQGRIGSSVNLQGGECTVGGIVVSRSVQLIQNWYVSEAVCPAGWWVCSAADRGIGKCPAAGGTTRAWVVDSVTNGSNGINGVYRDLNGVLGNDDATTAGRAAWCCRL